MARFPASEGVHADTPLTFEQTYPKYEFSELVRFGVLIGSWIGRLRRGEQRTVPTPVGIAPAE